MSSVAGEHADAVARIAAQRKAAVSVLKCFIYVTVVSG